MTQGRALVVEDDVAIRELLRLHLSLAGFGITEVGEGGRARTGPRDHVRGHHVRRL